MNVLLVDDHRLFRDGFLLVLKRMSELTQIIEAGTGAETKALLGEIDYDLAIIDYQLPDTTGIELLKQIKEFSPEVPVVIMSGSEDPKMIKQALNQGASDFFPKTLKPDEISDAVRLVLAGGFYVPFFVLELVKQDPKNSDNSELAHLAEVAQKVINESDWSIRANCDTALDQNAMGTFNRLLDKMETQHNELMKYAFYDSLTELPNRRLFEDRLKQARNMAGRSKKDIALVALDLDNFKQINDTHGHDIGDFLLQEIALRLLQSIRSIDTAARLGGDEFMVILTDVKDQGEVHEVIKRMFDTLTRPTVLNGLEVTPGVSIGITFAEGLEQPESIIKQADIALYQAKNSGRNRICFYTDPK